VNGVRDERRYGTESRFRTAEHALGGCERLCGGGLLDREWEIGPRTTHVRGTSQESGNHRWRGQREEGQGVLVEITLLFLDS